MSTCRPPLRLRGDEQDRAAAHRHRSIHRAKGATFAKRDTRNAGLATSLTIVVVAEMR
jgi:hypothetical protein